MVQDFSALRAVVCQLDEDGRACDDGAACTDDSCSGGICVSVDTCPPGEQCDVGSGQCVLAPLFTAYNDLVYDVALDGIGTDPNGQSVHYTVPNVTTFGIGSGFTGSSAGELLDQPTGVPTGVTVTMTQNGGVGWQPMAASPWHGGYDCAAGTDARDTFGGIADIAGSIFYGSAGWWVDLTFTGLNEFKRYSFATTASRAKENTDGPPGYPDRDTIYTISGVDAATNASTTGTQEYLGNPHSIWLNTGNNHAEGYVARWTDIEPGADGSFTVRAEAHPAMGDGIRAYAFDVFMLQEFPAQCLIAGDCDDGLFCNGAEICGANNVCQPGGDPCPGQLCRESDDQCVDCLGAGDCDDGLFCSGPESCDTNGLCQPGGDPCPGQLCRESDDQCVDCLSAGDCADGVFCNGAENCNIEGLCQPGGDPCPGQLCRESDDQCVDCLGAGDCDDGLFCNGTESCNTNGLCQPGADPCPGQVCRESDDQCVNCLTDGDCDDGVGCTDDTCVADDCVFTPNDANCPDDGLFCNGTEFCDAVLDCDSTGDPCLAPFVCRESTDTCEPPVQTMYDLSSNAGVDRFAYGTYTNSWAEDLQGIRRQCPEACTEVTTVTPDAYDRLAASDATGDETDPNRYVNTEPGPAEESTLIVEFNIAEDPADVTQLDLLWEGFGAGTGHLEFYIWDYVQGNWGDGQGSYGEDSFVADGSDALADFVLNGTVSNDVSRYIEPGTGQVSLLIYHDESARASFHDHVSLAVTVPAAQCQVDGDCNDGVGCTVDSCDLPDGACLNAATDALCDNGDFCDGTETCDPMLDCQAGTPVDCGDGVSCTDDSCNETTDTCDHVPNDANCDDGLYCTGAETCDAVLDCQVGAFPCGGGEWCEESADVCLSYGDGDFDFDSDVDLDDFAAFQRCFDQSALFGGCGPGNMTGDGLIDLDDFGAFSAAVSGPF
ncbi:MAG: hypothetical protein ACYSVY_10700 [Planctomycetota bacterium]|jgi:hypothetical protein